MGKSASYKNQYINENKANQLLKEQKYEYWDLTEMSAIAALRKDFEQKEKKISAQCPYEKYPLPNFLMFNLSYLPEWRTLL